MRLIRIEKLISNDRVRLTVVVLVGPDNEEAEIYFEYPDRYASFVSDDGDVFLPALLIPSMFRGEDLTIDMPVSKKLLKNINAIQDIFHNYYPHEMQKIKVFAAEQKEYTRKPGNNVGLYFSLGVDSFFSLYRDMNGLIPHVPPVTHLIYMKGFELPLSGYGDGQEQDVISKISEVAERTQKEVIAGETNIRDVFPLTWGPYYYGAGLASGAHSLSLGLNHVLVSSTLSYNKLVAWGSSPMMDPLWSTEKTTIIHVGAEISRAEKVGIYLSEYPLAMKYLRVCFRLQGSARKNCGKCYKCNRTMTALHITGNLNKAETFPHEFNENDVVAIANRNDLGYVEEILDLAGKLNIKSKLIRKIQRRKEEAEAVKLFANMLYFDFLKLLTAWIFIERPLIRLHKLSLFLKGKSRLYAKLIRYIYRNSQKS